MFDDVVREFSLLNAANLSRAPFVAGLTLLRPTDEAAVAATDVDEAADRSTEKVVATDRTSLLDGPELLGACAVAFCTAGCAVGAAEAVTRGAERACCNAVGVE